jgi:hypothetical protein
MTTKRAREPAASEQFWMVMLAFADQRGDLRPLADVLEARIPLPGWVLKDVVEILRKRRLRPRQMLSVAYKQEMVLWAKHLYDKDKPKPEERKAAQHLSRFVREFNDKHFWKPEYHHLRLTEASLKNLIGGRGRLARTGQQRRKAERRQPTT